MNTSRNMIIDKQLNKIITPDIAACIYNRETHRYSVKFKTGKAYPYSDNRISWLKDPLVLDPASYHITHNGFINGKTISIKRDNPADELHLGKEVSLKIYDSQEIAAGQSRYQIAQQPVV